MLSYIDVLKKSKKGVGVTERECVVKLYCVLPDKYIRPVLSTYLGPSHQPGKLHSAPETRDLMNEVAAKIPDKWAEVAIGLGLDFTDIKRIKTDIPTPNSTTLYCAVFDTWKNKVTEEYTWNTVLKALRTPLVDAHKLAEDIENQFLT